ncbi:hypothetical protein A0J61_03105 [Choanephora cucurbitarum]|uniref:Uncharacterized protein n=1 Tax=Choanephora cucurbitarum TaxID=101091 RepID=A0A1C7NK28_9FUNG|nr:hypothetical protein A0J61_03105 [Choanephora cucurbitarum]
MYFQIGCSQVDSTKHLSYRAVWEVEIAPGLYTAHYVGFIPISNHVEDSQLLKKTSLSRLNCRKVKLPEPGHKKKPKLLTASRSDADVCTRWRRGTWFSNSNPKSPIIIPSDVLCQSI